MTRAHRPVRRAWRLWLGVRCVCGLALVYGRCPVDVTPVRIPDGDTVPHVDGPTMLLPLVAVCPPAAVDPRAGVARRPCVAAAMMPTEGLVGPLRRFVNLPTAAPAWLIRTPDGEYDVIFSRRLIRTQAVWWISRAVLSELAWDRDVAVPLLDAMDDPDEAVKVAELVREYIPPDLRPRGDDGPMGQVPPV